MILGLALIISAIVLFIRIFFLESLLKGLLIFLVSIVLALFGGAILDDWSDWNDTTNKDSPVVSYRTFLALYKCTPDRWRLQEHCVYYRYQSGEDKKIDFKSYYDYLAYCHFCNKKEKIKEEMEQRNNQAEFIKQVQLIISKQEEENNQWLKERLEKIAYNRE